MFLHMVHDLLFIRFTVPGGFQICGSNQNTCHHNQNTASQCAESNRLLKGQHANKHSCNGFQRT